MKQLIIKDSSTAREINMLKKPVKKEPSIPQFNSLEEYENYSKIFDLEFNKWQQAESSLKEYKIDNDLRYNPEDDILAEFDNTGRKRRDI